MATDETHWWEAGRRTLRLMQAEATAFAAVVAGLPLGPFLRDTVAGPDDPQPPVVLVHGLCGDPTNFLPLRRHLRRRGVRRFASVAYLPRLDFQRVAPRLLECIEAVRRETGALQVDVVGHSLGGVIARHLMMIGHAHHVRRLVTLGSPWWAAPNPTQELAVYAESDAIVPTPPVGLRDPRRSLVVPDCGHLGLLTHATALDAVAGYLRRPVVLPGRSARVAA